jgi:hypothetical protein
VEIDVCDVVMGVAPGVDKVAIASLSSFAVGVACRPTKGQGLVTGQTGGPARWYWLGRKPGAVGDVE